VEVEEEVGRGKDKKSVTTRKPRFRTSDQINAIEVLAKHTVGTQAKIDSEADVEVTIKFD
jgi:hypothetical protein